MDQLWAPWRLAYVANDKPASEQPCFLCQAVRETEDRKNLVAWRTPRSLVVLNRFPYTNGHLLVAPHAHIGRLDELAADDHLDLMLTIQKMLGALDTLMKPDGYNIGLNLGKAAGAGLPGHVHWHVVPRWHGDTNFMPIVTDVKVIVQSLDALHELLVARLGEEG